MKKIICCLFLLHFFACQEKSNNLSDLALLQNKSVIFDLNNNILEPKSLYGKKTIINYWATWCGPCRRALPKNVEMAKKYSDQPFVLVGIHDARRGKDRIEEVLGPLNAKYPMAVDVLDPKSKSGSSAQACRLKYWPTYLVVDHKGIVRACGLQPSRVEDVVKRLLKEIPQETSPEPKRTSDPS